MGIALMQGEQTGKPRRQRSLDGLHDNNVFGVEQLLPSQFVRRQEMPAQPERRLMLAVFEDAVAVIGKYRHATDLRAKSMYLDAAAWVARDDWSWLFSFQNICAVLEFDPDAVRTALARGVGYTKIVRDRGTAPGAAVDRERWRPQVQQRTVLAVVK